MKNGMSIKGIIILTICAYLVLGLEWFTIGMVVAYFDSKDNNGANSVIDDIKNISGEFESNKDNGTAIDESEYLDYEVYTNSELGIKFRYPKEFTKVNEEGADKDGYTTVLIYNPSNGNGVNIVVGKTTGVFSFDSYKKASIDSLKKSYGISENDLEIEDKDVKMGGKKAFKNYYKYQNLNVYQCGTLVGSTEYVLTYSGKDADFEKEVGDKIFNSFEFVDESSSSEKSDSQTSSKENPIDLNVWGKASKYVVSGNSSYQDVNVMVTKITRGEDAKNIVKEYADTDKYFDYSDPADGEEWVVVEYNVDMQGLKIPSYGISPTLNVSVIGKDKYDIIKYNNKSYSPSIQEVSSDDYVKTTTATNKIAFQLPVGFSDYIIRIGSYDHTQTFVKGK